MPSTSPRTLLLILSYVAAVLVGGALLAPGLFFAAKGVMESSPDGALSQLLAKKGFPSYFNRAALVVAVIGLVPLLRSLRVGWRQVLGEVPLSTGWKQVLVGFAVAVAFTAIMGFVCGWAGAVRLKATPGWMSLAKPLLSGFTVSFLEEFLFRGAVLMILCHALGNRPGLWWTTGIFAILHFLKPPLADALPDAAVTWTSGLWVITQLFRGFGTWENVIGEFLILAAVGWVLARARLASGGLWVSIGLHAGWVAGMKYFGQIVDRRGALDLGEFSPWMVKNTCRAIVSPIVGIVPLTAVLLTGLVVLWITGRWWPHRSEKAIARRDA